VDSQVRELGVEGQAGPERRSVEDRGNAPQVPPAGLAFPIFQRTPSAMSESNAGRSRSRRGSR
jgi:hypothetical protein